MNDRSRFPFVSCVLLMVFSCQAWADKLPSIFNGKDLGGWKAPEGNQVWFTVGDQGELKLQNGPEKSGQTLWTEKEFKNFVMEFDFHFGEGTNDTGIYVRSEKEQIQIGISGSLKKDMTGLPYIAGKGYPVNNEEVLERIGGLLQLKDWNSMTIVAKGKNYAVWLNGDFIMSYDSDTSAEKGPVGIQLHGNRVMSCKYRNIRLAELD